MKERTDTVPRLGGPVKVYVIKIQRQMANPWEVNLYRVTPAVITRGERLRITFRARSADKVPFIVNFERYGEPYTKSVSQKINTTDKWQKYTVDFTAIESYPAEKSYTTFQCGIKRGNLEIADLHLVRVPKYLQIVRDLKSNLWGRSH
ncbi:carbohydrate binding domain-containing protein, partial [Nostoc sp. CHAB 5834]|nr:carbohydrate binding domain-containing protein [Nostoc sp. CHAB 5834]